MESVFLVVHLMVALAIIIIVLIQPAESGGFVGGGNMSGMMKPRSGADTLQRLTTIFAGIFFVTSLSLAVMAKNSSPEKDILKLADEAAAAKEVKEEKPKAPISK